MWCVVEVHRACTTEAKETMQDQYLPPDVVKSTFRRLRSKADNKVRNFFFEALRKVSVGNGRGIVILCR